MLYTTYSELFLHLQSVIVLITIHFSWLYKMISNECLKHNIIYILCINEKEEKRTHLISFQDYVCCFSNLYGDRMKCNETETEMYTTKPIV